MTEFALTCPHCGSANDDPFEVFTRGTVDWNSCLDCDRRFYYFIGDCNTCEAETPFTWPVEPVGITSSDLKCGNCGSRYGHDCEAQHGSETAW